MNDNAAVCSAAPSCQLPAGVTNVLLPHDPGCRRDRRVRIGYGAGHTKPTTATSTRWHQRRGHIAVTHTKTGPGTIVPPRHPHQEGQRVRAQVRLHP